MIGPVAALALCRVVQDTAALVLWGAAAYLAWLVPAILAGPVARRLRRWCVALVSAAAMATLAMLPIETAAIGDGWRDAIDPTLMAAVLSDTGAGHAWAVQALAALLLVGFDSLAAGRLQLIGTAGAAALLLAGLCLTGHAAAQDGWLGLLHRIDDVIHVLAAGVWLGALAPVLLILPCIRRRESQPAAIVALRRFSRAGHLAVALVLLTGAANAALVMARWPVDLGSPYGFLLDAKVVVVACLVGLALVNRYILVPRLGKTPDPALLWLRRATLAELPLGFLVIALVSVFGLLDPN